MANNPKVQFRIHEGSPITPTFRLFSVILTRCQLVSLYSFYFWTFFEVSLSYRVPVKMLKVRLLLLNGTLKIQVLQRFLYYMIKVLIVYHHPYFNYKTCPLQSFRFTHSCFFSVVVPNHQSRYQALSFVLCEISMKVLYFSDLKWHTHRKLITPAFHFKILDNFLQSFSENSIKLVQKLQNEIRSRSFDIYPYINLCALDIICGKCCK